MLDSARTLNGFCLKSRDGELGHVTDFYFDDEHWAIRYLVANTGSWLARRKVLISPYAIGGVSRSERRIAGDLTRKQIEDSPSLDSDKPVSRQFETTYHEHYGWPMYWRGAFMWGVDASVVHAPQQRASPPGPVPERDPHLRSIKDVTGHHVQATDGEIGHVEDFLVDDETWAVRYLIVDTQNWWPGKRVLVSPLWIERVSWADAKLFVNLDRTVIKQAPAYTHDTPLNCEFEGRLHQHYQRPGYWLDVPAAMAPAR